MYLPTFLTTSYSVVYLAASFVAIPFVGTTGRYTRTRSPGLNSSVFLSFHLLLASRKYSNLYLVNCRSNSSHDSLSLVRALFSHSFSLHLCDTSGITSCHMKRGVLPYNNWYGDAPNAVFGTQFHAVAT